LLFLNEKDILKAAAIEDMIAAVEKAYVVYEDNDFQMHARSHFTIQNNSVLFMPCSSDRAAGTKIVTVFPENKDRPVTQGAVVLVDSKNGAVKALLDGTVLTALRTGALGGAAAKFLASDEAKSVGLIGTGYQGLYQIIAVCAVCKIQEIFLFNRSSSKIPHFIRNLKAYIKNIPIHTAETAQDLVQKSDIIITATTSATPVLPEADLYQRKLIIGIGSYMPHMREFPEHLLQNLKQMFIDSHDAVNESGDILIPLQKGWLSEAQFIPFSKVVTQKVKPDFTQTRVFKSTGMALFDLIAAETVYEKAVQVQLGQELDF